VNGAEWIDMPRDEPGDLTWRGPGDDNQAVIFMAVGMTLTSWERMLSDTAELFDLLSAPAGIATNRMGFMAFSEVTSPQVIDNLLNAGAKYGRGHAEQEKITDVGWWIKKLAVSRNYVAHGVVYSLGEVGYAFGPNNIARNKWKQDGGAKYQLNSASILNINQTIGTLHNNILWLIKEVSVANDL
jgi:hypothetical protein